MSVNQDVIAAVIYAVENGNVKPQSGATLIMGAHGGELLKHFNGADYFSYFAGDAGNINEITAQYKNIIILAPQQRQSILYMIALAFLHLDAGGTLIVAASNDTGGKALSNHLSTFGVDVSDVYKHKCRVAWTYGNKKPSTDVINNAIAAGEMCKRGDGLWTQAGVFCWDKTDSGSKLLINNIPNDINGSVADFGAGIGELGLNLFAKNPNIKLTSIEHDKRAVGCVVKNLSEFVPNHNAIWQDINAVEFNACFDFVITNPPFHDGKVTTFSLGETFLLKIAKSLKKGGKLLMVANNQLAYERVLQANFKNYQEIARENGFKVIMAVR